MEVRFIELAENHNSVCTELWTSSELYSTPSNNKSW